MLLTAIGLIMVLSASYASAMYNLTPNVTNTGGDPLVLFQTAVWLCPAGAGSHGGDLQIDYQHFRWMAPLALIASIGLLVLCYIPGLNAPIMACAAGWRVVSGGRPTFQPSEVAKIAVVLFFAARLCKRDTEHKKRFTKRTGLGRTLNFLEGIGFLELVPYGVVLLVVCGLVVFEPHMSGTILIAVGAASVLFASGISLSWFVGLGSIGAAGLWFIITQTKYMTRKINIWKNPWLDPRNGGFQPIQAMLSIASGGLLGRGLGQSDQKYGFVPEPENDMIFSIVVEELGLVGAFMILLLFSLLILRGYWLALHARDKFGMLTIVGLITLLAFQVFSTSAWSPT